MKKYRFLSIIMTAVVLLTSIAVFHPTVNAAAVNNTLRINTSANSNTITYIRMEFDTKEQYELRRSSASATFDKQTYQDKINTKNKTGTSGPESNIVRLTLGTLNGQAFSLNTFALSAKAMGSPVTTYGSTYLTITTNCRNVETSYSYDTKLLNVKAVNRGTYEVMQIESKRVGAAEINLNFVEKSTNKTRKAKVVVNTLSSEETVKKIRQAGEGTYNDFEHTAQNAECWPAARNVSIWKNANCSQPLNFNVWGKTADGKDGWKKTSCLYVQKANGKESFIKCYVSKDPVTKKMIDGNKVFVKVWDAKGGKYVYGWINDTRFYINMPDIIPSIDYTYINSVSASAKCSGVSIPGVTGKSLSGKSSAVPIRISTARKIQMAQNIVKRYGLAVSVAEAYRPLSVQNAMAEGTYSLIDTAYSRTNMAAYDPVRLNVTMLAYREAREYPLARGLAANKDIYGGMYVPTDNVGWYIVEGTSSSSHQNGRAIDCTLASYATHKRMITQCPIQDLSAQAVITEPKLRNNDGEKALNYLFTNQKMQSIITEWWHFEEPIKNDYYKSDSGSLKTIVHRDSSTPDLGILQCRKTL